MEAENIDQDDLQLPKHYTYLTLNKPSTYNFEASKKIKIYKIKEIDNEYKLKVWLDELADIQGVEWRTHGRKYDNPRAPCIFKIRKRCHHNTYPRSQTADHRISSKNTHCPMNLKMSLIKPRDGAPIYCELEISHDHNHPVNTASSLAKRDVGKDVVNQLKKLFNDGYSAYGALAAVKMDLQLDMTAEEYMKLSADRSVVPDTNFVQKLYSKWQTEGYGDLNSSTDQLINSHCEDLAEIDDNDDGNDDNDDGNDDNNDDDLNNEILNQTSLLLNELSTKIDNHSHDEGLLAEVKSPTQMIGFLNCGRRVNRSQASGRIRRKLRANAHRQPIRGRVSQPATITGPPRAEAPPDGNISRFEEDG